MNLANQTNKLYESIEIKDKMIDKMAEMLDNFDIDEKICKNVEKCNIERNPSNNICKECIKNYFYKVAKNEQIRDT